MLMKTHTWRRAALAFVLGMFAWLASGAAFADPPSRVVRLSYASGNVTFSPGGEEDWSRGAVNRPLYNGDRIWVDDSSLAELEMGATRVRAGERTSLSVLAIDDDVAQLELTEGSFEVRVWQLDRGQEVEVDTPNLAVVIREPGSYRVDVDGQDGSTGVTVRTGSVTLYGEDRAFPIGPGDTWRFYDTALADFDRDRPDPPDELQRFAAGRDARWQRSASARYVPRDMIGFDDLDEYGTWRQVPQYGWVWAPTRVAAGWAPYRDGHWAWVEPWGWTWIDAQPWGFAPSHYGRWAFVQQHWYWVPGPRKVRPVYAPALVVFLGGSGLSATIGTGGGAGGVVGWFPLGPREVYRPSYPVSRDYFTRVNVTNTVVNVTQVVNVYQKREVKNVYVNQRVPNAVVAVPTQAFVQARPVAREIVRMRAPEAQPQAIVQAPPPVVPAKQSVLGTQPAQHRPPAQLARKQVVAQRPPPPPPAPIESKLQQLREHPGQPAAAASAPARREQARPANAPQVKVLERAKPAAAPPSAPAAPATAQRRAAREQRREERDQQRRERPAAAPAAPAARENAPAPAAPQPQASQPRAAQPQPQQEQRREQRDEQRQQREVQRREPQAPAARPAPPQPATPAAPTPPAPAPAPAARQPEAPPPRAAQPQQDQRREQLEEQRKQREQERQQRESQRRETPAPAARPATPPPAPAPAARPAPPPPGPAAPAHPEAAPSRPAPAPAQRAEQRRERASEMRQEREQRREDRKQ
jgi:hypothetical protein